MGNSEVGHLNIGAGRIVWQALSRINKDIREGGFFTNPALLDTVQEANLDDWDAMIDGNVKGLMYVTKAVLPFLRESSWGHIINVGSIAGKEPYPKGSVYCASKAAVQYFTDGLRLDLNPEGIRVSAIHPGLVETEFSMVRFKGDADRSKTVYQGVEALRADDVADAILYMVEAPRAVTIADLVILPTRQASAYIINREH